MEADNQNSWGKIRKELDQLSEVPGEAAFNTNAAWNKLSDRLEPKPIHRKPAFYWAAAATLLLLITAGWFILQNPNEQKLVNSPSNTNPSNKPLPPDTSVVKSMDIKSKENLVVYPPDNSSTITSASVPARKKKRASIETPSLMTINSQAEPKIEPADSITSKPAQSLLLVQSTPLKKLKVIHNNQLNSVIYKPELSISNTTSIYPPAPGNIRFSRNASDNIFQIKLSSTN